MFLTITTDYRIKAYDSNGDQQMPDITENPLSYSGNLKVPNAQITLVFKTHATITGIIPEYKYDAYLWEKIGVK